MCVHLKFRLATFQMLNSSIRLVATVLDNIIKIVSLIYKQCKSSKTVLGLSVWNLSLGQSYFLDVKNILCINVSSSFHIFKDMKTFQLHLTTIILFLCFVSQVPTIWTNNTTTTKTPFLFPQVSRLNLHMLYTFLFLCYQNIDLSRIPRELCFRDIGVQKPGATFSVKKKKKFNNFSTKNLYIIGIFTLSIVLEQHFVTLGF